MKGGEFAATFIVEPIQGEGGINVPPKDYFQGMRELCDKYGVYFYPGCDPDRVLAGPGRFLLLNMKILYRI